MASPDELGAALALLFHGVPQKDIALALYRAFNNHKEISYWSLINDWALLEGSQVVWFAWDDVLTTMFLICASVPTYLSSSSSISVLLGTKSMKKKPSKRRSAIVRDLRTPKYRPRVVPNKKRKAKAPAVTFGGDE